MLVHICDLLFGFRLAPYWTFFFFSFSNLSKLCWNIDILVVSGVAFLGYVACIIFVLNAEEA